MKKFTAIALLAMILFYQGGYALLFQYFIHQSDRVMNVNIGTEHYKPSDLVEIKIPVKLPSVNFTDEYQSLSGQMQYKGKYYNYVKLKVSMDTMYLMVIPNNEKTRLVNADVNYGKQINDEPINKKSHLPQIKKNTTDSEHLYTTIELRAKAPLTTVKPVPALAFLRVKSPPIDVPVQPPDGIARYS